MATRKAITVEVKRLCLHEAGYKCGNPACRGIITLDLHHLEYVSEGGGDGAENLLALCPNCHALHHAGHIPTESIRTWKMLLLSLNEGYDRRSVDMLLMLAKLKGAFNCTADGMLNCSALIASGLIQIDSELYSFPTYYRLKLSERGRQLVDGWKAGKQREAIGVKDDQSPSTSVE